RPRPSLFPYTTLFRSNSRIWFTTLIMFGSPTPRMVRWPMPARMPPPPAPEDIRKPAATHQPKARYGLNPRSTGPAQPQPKLLHRSEEHTSELQSLRHL